VRILGADCPYQAPHPALLQIWHVTGQQCLRGMGRHEEVRQLAWDQGQFAGDARPGTPGNPLLGIPRTDAARW
jgi:hypothetical protein